MAFYTLEQELNEEDSYILTELPDVQPPRPWYTGEPFTKHPPTPIEFPMEANSGPVMPDFFSAGIPVFSRRLYQAFQEAGVDNLQAYEAVMVDLNTGLRFADYYAINVVGKVSGANLRKSSYTDPTGSGQTTMFFQQLVLEPSRVEGLLCFRLAESVGELIVHEKVVRHVQSKRLRLVRFDKVG
jgi:hypothetical protein